MLGRLPVRYRAVIWVAGLLTFTGFGAWLTLDLPTVSWRTGSLVGLFLGTAAVAVFLHVLERSPEPARLPRRRT